MSTFKTLLTLGLLLALGMPTMAQSGKDFYKTPYKSRNNGTFDRKSSLFSIGLGLPSRYAYSYGSGNGNIAFPALYLKYEHGIMDEVGIGGYIAASGSRYKYGNYVDRRTYLNVSVLAYYHFNKLIPVKKLDVYAGVGGGVRHRIYHNDAHNHTSGETLPVFVGKVGARYYFTPKFGAYGEVGSDGMSDVNVGITFRF